MYYWHILQRDDNELVFKFVTAQKLSPSVHDWVLQIKKDKSNLDICLTDEEIKEIKKDKFKKLVEQQVEKFAMNYLENIRKSHSKTEYNIGFLTLCKDRHSGPLKEEGKFNSVNIE